jgi:Flp pilus assembly protein TadD
VRRRAILATVPHAAALLAALLLAAGCAGGRGGAARPDGGVASGQPGSLARLIAEADAAIAAGNAAAARRSLDRALATAPESVSTHLARGRFFAAIRRYKDAKEALDRAASLDPRNPEPPYQLGLAYVAAGDKDAARDAFGRAIDLDPGHAAARTAMAGLMRERYEAAGIPGDYPLLAGRSTLSRGELGVMLAVELGVDPDQTTWRSDEIQRTSWPELDQAWGARWLRASLMRRWIPAFPDNSYHLDDPVTRGQLAILLARVAEESRPASALAGAASARAGEASPQDTLFADLSYRHYLTRAASRAVLLGLPLRDGKFQPLAAATGDDAVRAVRGLSRFLGATPIVRGEPGPG